MLLTISTTHHPATDLGYLLGKHPDRYQERLLSFGRAHIFYPEATAERCTVALLLEINAVQEARRNDRNQPPTLAHYVNDRPYVASSFLATAIAKVFGSALNGNSESRAELVDQPIPLEVQLTALPVRGGTGMIDRFFTPLGYTWQAEAQPLDPQFPDWGDSPYYHLRLQHQLPLRLLLNHLYVLIPVLDNHKHYYVGKAEAEKLLAKGAEWLPGHPERELITQRYLRYRAEALQYARDQWADEPTAPEETTNQGSAEAQMEKAANVHDQRHARVVELLRERGATTVLDLGCGSGKLLRRLLEVGQFDRIVGMDTSHQILEMAASRLRLDQMTPRQRERIELIHGALTYRDRRLEGFEAAVLVEVIEHIDPQRLPAVEQVVFRYAKPKTVIVTTPNREYNATFATLAAGTMRHPDHRFEWTRQEFAQWCENISQTYGYTFDVEGLGPVDPQYGPLSQLAYFTRMEKE